MYHLIANQLTLRHLSKQAQNFYSLKKYESISENEITVIIIHWGANSVEASEMAFTAEVWWHTFRLHNRKSSDHESPLQGKLGLV